jgi:hypothetical protein
MKTRKCQQGVTLPGLVFILLFIGFTAYTVLKLFPVYMENFTISSSLESLEQDPVKEYIGVGSVRSAVLKRFGMNNVHQVSVDDVIVIREGQFYNVDVDYEVVIPFFKNISLLVTFKNHAEVSVQ